MERLLSTFAAVVLILTACGENPEPGGADIATDDIVGGSTVTENTAAGENGAEETEDLFPDVVGVEATHDGDGSWTFHVTLSSPYDTPERYADAWRVVGPNGAVYGERVLLHDHAGEQPFTRSQSGIEIPAEVTTVTVEGRDQLSGWGGATMDVTLER